MEWLNYHHLLYFWVVARRGSVTRAAAELRLGQPTISAQLRTLEESLGEKLFRRVGRHLVLTDVGRDVFRYADEIFSLGRELLESVRGRPTARPMQFMVGIADVMPKLIAHRLLEPARALHAEAVLDLPPGVVGEDDQQDSGVERTRGGGPVRAEVGLTEAAGGTRHGRIRSGRDYDGGRGASMRRL